VRDKRGRWESRHHKPTIAPSQDETFHCSSCNFCTTNQWKFTRHNATQKHLLLSSGGGENAASRVLVVSPADKDYSASDEPRSNSAGTEAFDSHAASTSVVRLAHRRRRKRDAAAAKSAREGRGNSTRKSALSAQHKVFPTFLLPGTCYCKNRVVGQSAMWAGRRYTRAVLF